MTIRSPQWVNSIEHACWQDESQNVLENLPKDFATIMSDKGSLTSALRSISNETFEVKVLKEELTKPYPSEAEKLGLKTNINAKIRQVELFIHGTPVVYARSVIPTYLIERAETGLANLGTKPLGHLLFKDGKMKKSRREFTSIEGVQGRRTPYDYEGGTILVNEFFLTALKNYL